MSLLIVLHTKSWNWSNQVEEDTPIEIPLSSQDKPNQVSDFSTNLRYLVSVLRLFHLTSACVDEAPFSKCLNNQPMSVLSAHFVVNGINLETSRVLLVCLFFFFFFLFEKDEKFIKRLSHHWSSPGGKLFNVCLLRGIACAYLRLTKESVYTSV